MKETVLCQRYKATGRIKQMGMHNGSKNCHGAWVALCDHPIHTDTDKDTHNNEGNQVE
jgi:hypothetical protein